MSSTEVVVKRNPLSQMFGAFIRKQRNSANLTSAELASKLGISDAMIRMIESGHANLHGSRAFAFIAAFNNLNVQYGMLVKLLNGILYIQSVLDTGKNGREAFMELSTHDTDVELLFIKSTELFSSGDQKAFLTNMAPMLIEDFLQTNFYSAKSDSDRFLNTLSDKVKELRSLSVDLLFSLVSTLDKHPPMHIGGIAEEWERDNKDRFKSLVGIYRKSDIIVSKENLKLFSHSYLEQDHFIKTRYIFLNEKRSTEDLKNDYFDLIKKFHPYVRINAKIRQKVNFRTITTTTLKKEAELILKGSLGNYESLDAFWAFQMAQDNYIGFLGVREEKIDNIVNLKYGEVEAKLNLFENLWNKASEV